MKVQLTADSGQSAEYTKLKAVVNLRVANGEENSTHWYVTNK